jgi:hypothetical protein
MSEKNLQLKLLPPPAYLHQHADVFIWFWRGQDALKQAKACNQKPLCARTQSGFWF